MAVEAIGRAPASPQEWMAVFRELVYRLIADEETTRRAIDGIVGAGTQGGVSPSDRPATAIAQIYESHNRMRVDALKALSEFVVVCGGDVPRRGLESEASGD